MKAGFGIVALLIVAAVGALLAVKQMKAGAQATRAALVSAGQAPAPGASGTSRDPSVDPKRQLADDLAKSLNDGAAARQSEVDKP